MLNFCEHLCGCLIYMIKDNLLDPYTLNCCFREEILGENVSPWFRAGWTERHGTHASHKYLVAAPRVGSLDVELLFS